MSPASAPEPHARGNWLLRIARVVFDEPALSTVVYPAIADVQHELHDVQGASVLARVRRSLVWLRGLLTLVRMILAVAFEPPLPAPAGTAVGHSRSQDIVAAFLLTIFFLAFAVATPVSGWFTAGSLASGLLFAAALHRWYRVYAGFEPDPDVPWRAAEINFASIPVGGNAAGLVVAIGSVVILVVGLPEFAWFLALAIGSGVLLAMSLRWWRSAHSFSSPDMTTLGIPR
jgi:hypothetical protein